MKRINLVVLFIFLIGTYSGFSQNGDNKDKNLSGLEKDLSLTDAEFFKKYVDQFGSGNTQYLYKSYVSVDDPEIKIFILLSAKDKWNDPFAFKIFQLALGEGFTDSTLSDPQRISASWKVRATAAYLIYQKPQGLEKYKVKYIYSLLNMMKQDPEERCRGIAVLTLARLFSTEHQKEEKSNRNDVTQKNTIIEILTDRLDKISVNDQFFCWALVKALGDLASPKSFYTLLSTRKKGFNEEIKREISKSVQAIVGSSKGGGK